MKKKHAIMFMALSLLIATAAVSAWASDKAQASVTATSPSAVVTPNGMAVGTIHVVYTANAYQFTPGSFGNFNLDLSILAVAGNPETSYPLTLRLSQKQSGADSLVLTPDTGSFAVADNSWTGGTRVSVAVPAGTPDADGTTLTGILQIEADGPPDKNSKPTNPQLNTITTVVVKIVLLHPTACLKMVNFVTDAEFNSIDGAVVNLKTKGGVSTVASTNPGQFSNNILIANRCGTDQQLDLKISLDSCFDTNPSGNPGQAVFTYLTTGEVDEESFDINAFGAMTGQGQNLCLSRLIIPTDQTLLATVHMGAIKNMLAGNLPADTTFDFSATVYDSASNGCTTGTLNSLADPNPAGAAVQFTTK
jgi:hypothetical protein